ncbi:hypothetical protein P7C70_g5873, partial [Phenoliferia sp. Uapishka_3]
MLLRATQLLPFTSRSNALALHLWVYHKALAANTILIRAPPYFVKQVSRVRLLARTSYALVTWRNIAFRLAANEVFGKSKRTTSFIEGNSWSGLEVLVGSRNWRERLVVREERWRDCALERVVLWVASEIICFFYLPYVPHFALVGARLLLVFMSVSLIKEGGIIVFGTFYWERATNDRHGQLRNLNSPNPHRSHLPRPQRYPSPWQIKKLLALPKLYGSLESRRFRTSLRVGDTGPPLNIPRSLPPPPFLSSIFVSIPSSIFGTLVFTVSLATPLLTLLELLFHRTGLQILSSTRATAHFLTSATQSSIVNLKSSDVFLTLAALHFGSGSELRLSVVLPGGTRHRPGSKAGGKRAKSGRKFQGSPRTVKLKQARKLANAKKLARQALGQSDSETDEAEGSPSPTPPDASPRATTSRAAEERSTSTSPSPQPSPSLPPSHLPSPQPRPRRRDSRPVHPMFQRDSNDDSDLFGNKDNDPGHSSTASAPDFPIVNDPFHPPIEDPEGELEAEQKAEEADHLNVGRISRLAYVKDQLALLKQQLPRNSHSAVPYVYRRKTLWIRRPDRCFLLNDRASKTLPSMSDLLLPDILLILPCILLRLASPEKRLVCLNPGCGGQPIREGWSDQPARDVGGLKSYMVMTADYRCNSDGCSFHCRGTDRRLLDQLPACYDSDLRQCKLHSLHIPHNSPSDISFTKVKLSYRFGLDRVTTSVYAFLQTLGLGASRCAELTAELHKLEYDYARSDYLSEYLQRRKLKLPGTERPPSSAPDFGDPNAARPRLPSAAFIQTAYTDGTEERRDELDQAISLLPANQLQIDGNFKSVLRVRGIAQVLHTAMNQYNEMRLQVAAITKSTLHLRGPLARMCESLEKHGFPQTSQIWIDDPVHEASHWEKNLPGLRKDVFHVPPPNLTGLPTATLPSSLRRSYLRLASDMERAAAGILAQSASQVVGLDIEWTVEVGEGGRPVANVGWHRTGTIQVATSTEVVIFQIGALPTAAPLPSSLLRLLESTSLIKVGRGIATDFVRLKKDFKIKIPTSSLLDLADVCSEKGVGDPKTLKGRHSAGLDDLVRLSLGLYLSKDEAVCLSNWDEELSDTQQDYAALDAWIGLEVHRRVTSGTALGLPTNWKDPVGTAVSLVLRGQHAVADGQVVRWPGAGQSELLVLPDGSEKVYHQHANTQLVRITVTSVSNADFIPLNSKFSLGQHGSAPFDLVLPASIVLRRPSTIRPSPTNSKFARELGAQVPAGAPELDQDEADRLCRFEDELEEEARQAVEEGVGEGEEEEVEGSQENDEGDDNEEVSDGPVSVDARHRSGKLVLFLIAPAQESHPFPKSARSSTCPDSPTSEEPVSPPPERQTPTPSTPSPLSIATRVHMDLLHVFLRIAPSKRHPLAIPASRDLRNLLFVYDSEDKAALELVLETRGETFEEALERVPKWVLRRVRRKVPGPDELVRLLKLYFERYNNKKDIKHGIFVFPKLSFEQQDAVLELARRGFLSDPEGEMLFEQVSDLLVEKFAFLIDDFLVQAHWGSHYDISLCNSVDLLHQQVFGTSGYPHFVNGRQFRQTSESFGIVPLDASLALDLNIQLLSNAELDAQTSATKRLRPRDRFTRDRLNTLHPISSPTVTTQMKSAFIAALRTARGKSAARKGKSSADHPPPIAAAATLFTVKKLPDFRKMALQMNSQVDRFGMHYTIPLFLGQHYGVLQRYYAGKKITDSEPFQHLREDLQDEDRMEIDIPMGQVGDKDVRPAAAALAAGVQTLPRGTFGAVAPQPQQRKLFRFFFDPAAAELTWLDA